MHPTVWRERVAFWRAGRGETPGRILLADTATGGVRRVPGGTPGYAPELAEADAMDLRGTRLAFAWAAYWSGCVPDPGDEEGLPNLTEVWLWRPGHRSRIDRACDDARGVDFVGSPALIAGTLGYIHRSTRRRRDLLDGLTTELPAPDWLYASQDGSTLSYVRFVNPDGAHPQWIVGSLTPSSTRA